jgi:DNA invertase Pin-like site-specific DNA recombinase
LQNEARCPYNHDMLIDSIRTERLLGKRINSSSRPAHVFPRVFEARRGVVWPSAGRIPRRLHKSSTGRLMIAVLGGLADVERDLIRTRTAEGRSRAQKRGQHMGRPAQKAEARRRRAQGATLAELARSYQVAKSTISRL